METLLRERHGSIEILTINRPEARNAIDSRLSRHMDEMFEELEHDSAVEVVILTATGDQAFSAGVDLKEQARLGTTAPFVTERSGYAGITQRQFSKPLIAAVNGYALGGGLEIVLACDLVVAAENATFASPEARLGALADGGTLLRLPHWVPLPIAKEIVFLGQRMSARRAYEVGLVNRVVPGEDLLPTALAMAREITENAPIAVRWSKRAMHELLNVRELDGWRINAEYSRRIESTADFQEGAQAFAEKRRPKFEGR